MGIKFHCHACTKRLNVKEFLAGKRGICPHCGSKVEIPQQSQAAGQSQGHQAATALPHSVAAGGQANGAAAPHQATLPVAGKAAPLPTAPTAGAGIGTANPAAANPAQAAVPMAAPVAHGTSPATAPQGAAPVGQGQAIPAYNPTADAVSQSHPAQAASVVPAAPPTEGPRDPIDEAPGASWFVRPPSGGQYGPASGDIMRKWVAEGRVSADSLVWREGWPDWKTASSQFASLGGPASPSPVAPTQATAGAAPYSYGNPAPGAVSPAPDAGTRTYARRRSSNSLAVILVVLLTLASLGLFGVLIAVIQFVNQ